MPRMTNTSTHMKAQLIFKPMFSSRRNHWGPGVREDLGSPGHLLPSQDVRTFNQFLILDESLNAFTAESAKVPPPGKHNPGSSKYRPCLSEGWDERVGCDLPEQRAAVSDYTGQEKTPVDKRYLLDLRVRDMYFW